MTTAARMRQPLSGEAYVDDGCEVHPACLSCPLPACRYDNPWWFLAWRNADRDADIAAEYERQESNAQRTATLMGTSTRSVYRALARHRAYAELVA
jgi:hypothetical protein